MSPLAASAVQPCSQREDDRPKLRLAGALGYSVTGTQAWLLPAGWLLIYYHTRPEAYCGC
jgi:hypothetical protein